jgi:uncharacterized membrane-anchored protein YjiN (DUF445 family)
LQRASEPQSIARKEYEARLAQICQGLANGDPAYVNTVNALRNALVEYDSLSSLIRVFLTKLRMWAQEQGMQSESKLMNWLLTRTKQLLYEFRVDSDKRMKVDAWIKEKLKEYITPAKLRGVVTKHLKEMDNRKLRDLIEKNVGDELQMIRLNGAVIGGLVGLVIGLARWFL